MKPPRALEDALFRLLVESVKDYAIFLLDPAGRVLSWNPGAERLKGYKSEEIIGKHFSVFYPQPDATIKPAKELEIATREGRFEEEGWRLRKDGTLFWANVVISAVRDEEGTLVAFSKVTRDLSERRMADEALRRSNQELEEYAGFVSHDLQEPLRKMASYAELLRARYSGKLDDTAQGYIRLIVDAAERMRKLIVDVLEYARLGRSAPALDRIELHDVVLQALKDLQVAIEESKASVELQSLPAARGNGPLLTRLFQNLISNAVKYRKPGAAPAVSITGLREGGEVIVSVRDNGIGFDQSQAERILRPFTRLHPKEEYAGSGLGLAASKRILELHRGRMWAESKPGEGSTFHVALPAA